MVSEELPISGVYEKAIGAFNDSERPKRPSLVEAPWWVFGMPPDSMLKPDAWPRFSIWPFRLRRGGRA